MNVVYTETSQILATRLARALTFPLVDIKYSRFPDGVLYLLAGKTGDETVIVGSVVDNNALVQSPPAHRCMWMVPVNDLGLL